MTWLDAIILGLVEGITEYLPISSTGHLIITSALLGLDEPPEVKSAVDAFNIVIQGGAILAVLGLYWPRVLRMIRGVFGKDRVGLTMAINVIVAFLPAAFLGVLLDELIERHLFSTGPVIAALLLGAIWMMWLDKTRLKPARDAGGEQPGITLEQLDAKRALLIGLLQCVAMWPGTSRSMMTIAGGVLVGLKPKDAAEFSFLLGLPTLGGACVYKLYKNVTGDGPNLFEQLGTINVVLGIAVATVSAVLAVKWLVGFLNKHGLMLFGWYRIGLCVVLGGLIAAGVVSIGPGETPIDPAPITAPAAP